MNPGDVVWIRAFDAVPRHRFRVLEVREHQITGFALSGPLAGCYGEPDRVMVETKTPEEPVEPETPEQPGTPEQPEAPDQGTPVSL